MVGLLLEKTLIKLPFDAWQWNETQRMKKVQYNIKLWNKILDNYCSNPRRPL
jgi:hypothetical protein